MKTNEEQLYFEAGKAFAKRLKICEENKWHKNVDVLEAAIENRINKVKDQPNLIKALKKGLNHID